MADSAERVEQIRARERAATEGPWIAKDLGSDVYNSHNKAGWWWVWQESKQPYYGGVLELDTKPDGTADFNGGNLGQAAITDNDDGVQEQADAEFMAHSREDIPWLLARVAELEAELESAIISDIAARNPGIDLAELRAYRREKGLARG